MSASAKSASKKPKLIPLGDRVVVEREVSGQKTAGGILLPDSAKDKPARGRVVSVGEGAKLAYVNVQKNQFNGTWRLAFGIKPDGSNRPVELRGFLRKPQHVLTETWTYLWQP